MVGNVREWTEDYWHDSYDGAPSDGSAWIGLGIGDYRVVRGGSRNTLSDFLRSAHRDKDTPRFRFGFSNLLIPDICPALRHDYLQESPRKTTVKLAKVIAIAPPLSQLTKT
jgi:hypothetical protein